MRRADVASAGFEHNFQSLRVVDTLEQRYPAFDGLNLTFEAREGILKHCSRRRARELEVAEPGGVGRRFIDATQPGLEAQLCNLADEIAYNTHDIDDGVRSGLLVHEQLLALPLFLRFHREALAEHPGLAGTRLLYDVLRRMLSAQVYDLIEAVAQSVREHAPQDADDVRQRMPPIRAGADMAAGSVAVKAFLRKQLYRHPRVVETTEAAKQVVRELFEAYLAQPDQMPRHHAARQPLQQAVADYIAGMTDRFALREHARIYGPDRNQFPQPV